MSTLKLPLIVILGPNSSGKTSLAIKLASKFNGEIVSADSRQVYKGMDIGTGKATKQEQKQVKHYLIDVTPPKREYNVSHFKKDALQAISRIHQKNKLPFLVGGTGFWIQAVVDNIDFPKVEPNKILRRKLEKKTIKQLFNLLKKLDSQRAKIIDNKNPYRLIRAIEIISTTKKPIPKIKKTPLHNTLLLGLTHPQKKLYRLIDRRLKKRFKQGLIAEVRKLHQQGISWQRLYGFGLEYRYVSLYLQGKLTKVQTKNELSRAIKKFAKRQMTWFKRDKRINWIKNQKQAELLIKNLIK